MPDSNENLTESELESLLAINDGSNNFKETEKVDIEDASEEIHGVTPSSDSIAISTENEKINLEDASKEINAVRPSANSIDVSTENRKTYVTLLAGNLAKWLWIVLLGITCVHLIAVIFFAWFFTREPATNDKEQYVERINTAISGVNETAKTLYTFLGPLATAVTGYYFSNIEKDN